MKNESKQIKLTPWQEKFKQDNLPKPPKGLSEVALQLFNAAINKIQYIPTENGGLEINYNKLTTEEAFAIGRGLITPRSVKEMLLAAQRHINLGENLGGTVVIMNGTDSETIARNERLMDVERKKILVTEHGKKFPQGRPTGAISAPTKYINELVSEYPTKTAKDLRRLADDSIIGEMSDRTFANNVSIAKRLIKQI